MRACSSQILHENQFALLLFRATFSLSFSPLACSKTLCCCLLVPKDQDFSLVLTPYIYSTVNWNYSVLIKYCSSIIPKCYVKLFPPINYLATEIANIYYRHTSWFQCYVFAYIDYLHTARDKKKTMGCQCHACMLTFYNLFSGDITCMKNYENLVLVSRPYLPCACITSIYCSTNQILIMANENPCHQQQ